MHQSAAPARSNGWPAWLSVTGQRQSLEAARQAAHSRHERAFATVMERLGEHGFLDPESVDAVRARATEAIPRLLALVRQERTSRQSLGAAALLVRLGEKAGYGHFVRVFREGDAEQRLAAAALLAAVSEGRRLDDPELVRALLEQLDSPDPRTREAAVQACGILNLPGAAERFARMLDDPAATGKGRLCYWLGQHAPSAENLRRIETLLASPHPEEDDYWIVSGVLGMAQGPDSELAGTACDVLRRHLDERESRNPADPFKHQEVVRALLERATAASVPWLRERLARAASPGEKADVLVALARVEGEAGRKRLVGQLGDPELARRVAPGVGEVCRGTRDPAVIDALHKAAQREEDGYALASIAEAILAVGGPGAQEAARGLAGRLPPPARMKVLWQVHGWTLQGVMPKVVASGLLDEPAYRKALAAVDRGGEDMEGLAPLESLLLAAGVAIVFDTETGMLPCRHDRLLVRLAEITRGVFRPEACLEEWRQKHTEDYEADYTLQFIHGGRLYRARLRNLDDWYDVERVVRAANQAIADAGRAERFVPLYTGDQMAELVFGRPESLRRLAEELHLPLDDDPGRAMRVGKEYEKRAIERLGHEER